MAKGRKNVARVALRLCEGIIVMNDNIDPRDGRLVLVGIWVTLKAFTDSIFFPFSPLTGEAGI